MARSWWMGALVVLLAHCDSNTPRGPNEPQPSFTGHAVLAPGAKALDARGLAALASASLDGRLVFSTTSPVLDDVLPGDVLIMGVSGATPSGALRRIVAVTGTAPGLTLETVPARLEEAFEELSVEVDVTVTPEGPSATNLSPRAEGKSDGITVPFTLSESGNDGTLELDGSLFLAPEFGLELDLDIVSFTLEEMSMRFGAQQTFVMGLTGQGNASIDESITLAEIPFAPITLIIPTPAGPIPLVLTPGIRVDASLVGSTQGQVEASVTEQAGFTAGLGYKDGAFGGFSDSQSSFNFEQPVYQAGVNLKAAAGPRFEVLIYGAVGPFAEVEAYVELAASLDGPPPCAKGVIDAGLAAKVGVEFIADYETTLFHENYPLATFDSCSNDPSAPRPAVTWARSLGREGSRGERAKAVTQLSDGTYVVIGDSDLFDQVSGFAASLWTMRLDALGNVMWQRAFGRWGAFGTAQAVAEVPGGILVAASSGAMKLDTGGNLVWAKTYDSGQYLQIGSVAVHGDGGFLAAGSYGNTAEAWAMKVDAEGEVGWSRTYGGTDFARVRVSRDGGYVLAGLTDSNASDMFVVKLDAAGDVVWKRALDNRFDASPEDDGGGDLLPTTDRAFDVVERPGGGYVVVGDSYGGFPIPIPIQAGFYAAWVAELNAQGDLDESTVYRCPDDASYGSAYAVELWPNGEPLIIGRRADTASDLLRHEDILIIRGGAFTVLGASGNDAVYPGLASGRAMPIHLTQDGGVMVVATTDSFAGSEQFWLLKLDKTGAIRFPFRESLPGSSFRNDDAVSMGLSSGFDDVPMAVSVITGDVRSEVTSYVVNRQSP